MSDEIMTPASRSCLYDRFISSLLERLNNDILSRRLFFRPPCETLFFTTSRYYLRQGGQPIRSKRGRQERGGGSREWAREAKARAQDIGTDGRAPHWKLAQRKTYRPIQVKLLVEINTVALNPGSCAPQVFQPRLQRAPRLGHLVNANSQLI